MKCPKCNYLLPEDSVFCQYCGENIAKATQLDNLKPRPTQEQQRSHAKTNKRFCKSCGSVIDNETNVYNGCGTKHFKMTRLFIGIVLIAIGSGGMALLLYLAITNML